MTLSFTEKIKLQRRKAPLIMGRFLYIPVCSNTINNNFAMRLLEFVAVKLRLQISALRGAVPDGLKIFDRDPSSV